MLKVGKGLAQGVQEISEIFENAEKFESWIEHGWDAGHVRQMDYSNHAAQQGREGGGRKEEEKEMT